MPETATTDPAIGEVLVTEDELEARIRELGREISADYAGRDLLLVGVLKGAVFFLSDLMRALDVCALLTKPERRKVELPIRFVGFEIPDRFAIGYGLDYAERYRNLPYVAALATEEAGGDAAR